MMTKQPAYYRDLLEALDSKLDYDKLLPYVAKDNPEYSGYVLHTRLLDVKSHISGMTYRSMHFFKTKIHDSLTMEIRLKKGSNHTDIKHKFFNGDYNEEVKNILLTSGFSQHAVNTIRPDEYRNPTPLGLGTSVYFEVPGVGEELKQMYILRRNRENEKAEKEQDELDRKRMREL
jgi:hypothetical protein